MTNLGDVPNLSPRVPETVGGTARPATGAAGAKPAGPAFEALLERLTTRAAELEEKSKTLNEPEDLPGALDAARSSLEDALALGGELIEAYRAAQQRTPGAETGAPKP